MAKEKANQTVASTTEAPEAAVAEKVVSEQVTKALIAASDELDGSVIGDGKILSAAQAEKILSKGNFFDPSLSQYVEGLVLWFSGEYARVKDVPVGKSGSTATVITVPAGHLDANGEPVFDKVFNVYESTLRKIINVADENGEPVLDEDNNPITISGAGNSFWEEMRGYKNEGQVLGAINNRIIECKKVLRGFGPSDYVNGKPTGHKLTSLPLFREIK